MKSLRLSVYRGEVSQLIENRFENDSGNNLTCQRHRRHCGRNTERAFHRSGLDFKLDPIIFDSSRPQLKALLLISTFGLNSVFIFTGEHNELTKRENGDKRSEMDQVVGYVIAFREPPPSLNTTKGHNGNGRQRKYLARLIYHIYYIYYIGYYFAYGVQPFERMTD